MNYLIDTAEEVNRIEPQGRTYGTLFHKYPEPFNYSPQQDELYMRAQGLTKKIFDHDPDLKNPEYESLAQVVQQFWSGGRGEIS